jgi:pimeloyl-ACP methyl ester carboxylesterase
MLPFDEVGSGPVVVLLHAGIADRTMWREQLEPFAAAGYRVLAVDLPGFGEAGLSDGLQAPWSDVLGTLDELKIDRAALVGNSLGGAIAMRIALIAPERVSALVLISAPPPVIQDPSEQLRAAGEAEDAALERDDLDSAVEAIVNAWTLPDASKALRDRVAAMQRRAFILQNATPNVSEAPDPLAERLQALSSIEVPTLVAAGERDMPDFIEGSLDMARVIPGATHALIPHAGHLAPLETPGLFRRLVLDFLAEHP